MPARENITYFLIHLCIQTIFGKTYIEPIYFETVTKPILSNILLLYNNAKVNQKSSILALVASNFSYQFLIDFCFHISIK